MKILVFGAGVLGSVYAARLAEAGEDVTILARGERLSQIEQHGIVLARIPGNKMSVTRVKTCAQLNPEDAYDLIIVLVRRNQLEEVLPHLAANQNSPHILFMTNNVSGPDVLTTSLGKERVLLGFAGAGGTRGKFIVRYRTTSSWLQVTTIGELNGRNTLRVRKIAEMLRRAGFPVVTCSNMDAWLKVHAALVSPVANAIYLANGSTLRLSRTRDGLVLLIRAVKEGFRVLRRLGYPLVPLRLWLLALLPEPLLVFLLKYGLATHKAELLLASHANAARDEMGLLAEEFHQLCLKAAIPTPAIDELCTYIDPASPVVTDRSATIPLRWRGAIIMGLTALSGITGLVLLLRKKR